MSRKVITVPAIALIAALCAAGPVPAAEESGENIAQIYHLVPIPGHEAAFEKGLRAHLDLHRRHGDTWTWTTWQVAVGEDVGSYYVHTGEHAWSDFDGMPEIPRDEQHVWEHISPHTASMSSFMTSMADDITRWPADGPKAKMAEIVIFRLRPGMDRAFHHAIRRLHDAIVEKNLPMRYSFEWVVAGNRGPELILAIPRADWAAFRPMENSFWGAVEEVYGDFEAQMLRKLLGKSVAEQKNFVIVLREDLSLMPKN